MVPVKRPSYSPAGDSLALASNPTSGWRRWHRRHLLSYPNWRVDVATFEQWTPPPGEDLFDLVCSAQAWHWLDPEVRLERAGAALRRGGWGGGVVEPSRPGPLASALSDGSGYDRLAPQMNQPPTALVVGKGPRAIAAQARFGDAIHRDYHWSVLHRCPVGRVQVGRTPDLGIYARDSWTRW